MLHLLSEILILMAKFVATFSFYDCNSEKWGRRGGGRGIVFEQGSGYGGDEDASLKMLDSLPTRNLQIFLQSFRLSVYL